MKDEDNDFPLFCNFYLFGCLKSSYIGITLDSGTEPEKFIEGGEKYNK
jgi:hypothetical protein